MKERHKVQRRYKSRKESVWKTDRRELSPLHKAIAVVSHEIGKQTCQEISDCLKQANITISRPGVQRLVERTLHRVKDLQTTIYDPEVYEHEPGRGRKVILMEQHKDQVFAVATESKACRMLTTYQLMELLPPEFPKCSVSTIESALYERGLRRVKGYWKPLMTPQKKQAR